LLGELDGIDVLLQQLSVSNSHTPSLRLGGSRAGREEVEQILGVALSQLSVHAEAQQCFMFSGGLLPE